MRALIINPEAKAKIEALQQYATDNPVSMRRLMRMVAGGEPPVGDDPKHCILLERGYRVVFSVDEQMSGKYRHLSVSVDAPGKWPSPQAVTVIAALFGFIGPSQTWLMEPEFDAEAINVLQRIP